LYDDNDELNYKNDKVKFNLSTGFSQSSLALKVTVLWSKSSIVL